MTSLFAGMKKSMDRQSTMQKKCIIVTHYMKQNRVFNSSPAGRDICRLLISFTNSLDPGQQNISPDLNPNWHSDCISEKHFFLKSSF